MAPAVAPEGGRCRRWSIATAICNPRHAADGMVCAAGLELAFASRYGCMRSAMKACGPLGCVMNVARLSVLSKIVYIHLHSLVSLPDGNSN